ncbi:uncharacterized protein LOC116341887 [Contarinia nasturtii]|uniref:uncharacterized protein LOC116341887 n=1 Tax=Contarinia nasturtii TaxID=265458 RepID=UPI0012D38193|nr:uncharacterized protein LOC116341887 [Contarinia nasturtii]XP_031625084.1 uncharacterized protein LOC116341887 [Contarinia nasturtii]
MMRVLETIYFGDLFLESMKRVKHVIVLITYVIPIIFASLYFVPILIWPSQRYYIHATPFQLFWFLTVSITAFILIFVEAYGKKIKMYKYYYCATWFLYEFIWCLSIYAYFDSVINHWSTEQCTKMLLPMIFKKFGVLDLFHFLFASIVLCLHWTHTSFIHISLSLGKLVVKEPKRTQYVQLVFVILSILTIIPPIFFLLSLNHEKLYYIQLFVLVQEKCSVLLCSSTLMVSFNIYYNLKEDMNPFGSILSGYGFSIFSELFLLWFLFILGKKDINYSHLIWSWISYFAIGRQAFLDMEINPQKYKDYSEKKIMNSNTIQMSEPLQSSSMCV